MNNKLTQHELRRRDFGCHRHHGLNALQLGNSFGPPDCDETSMSLTTDSNYGETFHGDVVDYSYYDSKRTKRCFCRWSILTTLYSSNHMDAVHKKAAAKQERHYLNCEGKVEIILRADLLNRGFRYSALL